MGRRLLPEAWISEAGSGIDVAGIGFTKTSQVLSLEAVAQRVPDDRVWGANLMRA